MGNTGRSRAALRGAVLLAAAALVALPLRASPTSAPQTADAAPVLAARRVADIDAPPVRAPRWTDAEWGVSLVPPPGWIRTPGSALNPISSPPDPVFEIARFQLKLLDPTLYTQPVALTGGLIDDAGAMLSIGVLRDGSDLAAVGEDMAEDGVRAYARYFTAGGSDRVVVARVMANDDAWPIVATTLFTALDSVRAQAGPKGAIAPLPAPPKPQATAAVAPPDATITIRQQIVARAALLLGIPYVWGGSSVRTGMDCSAWLSVVWDVERYSTDSIWRVSFPIAKEALRAGDALNLTTGRDPKHLGHIRLFEAWANAAHTVMWVYEETPPRSVHRVVVYDDRYEPIRLFGLSGAGTVAVVPGTPAPDPTRAPRATARQTPKLTPKPTARPTIRVTPRPSATATATVVPVGAALYTRTPTPKPSPTPR